MSEGEGPLVGYDSEVEARADMLRDDQSISGLSHSEADSFGAKTIGAFAGVCLMMNNTMGVGIPLLPALFQEAGFVSPLLVLLLVAVLAGLAATALSESMKYVPGNRDFDDRIEYASLCRFYLGRIPYFVIQVFLNLSLLAANILSILETVQVMDWTVVRLFRCTCGLLLVPDRSPLYNETAGFQCVCPPLACSHENSPFGAAMVVGVGFVVVILIIIPMGYFSLEDNVSIQVVVLVLQVLIVLQWISVFVRRMLAPDFSVQGVSAGGTAAGQGSVLGQVVLNYAFVMTVPSWCNEKRRSVNVNRVVWTSTSVSTFFYVAIGVMGALAFPGLGGEDILTALNEAHHGQDTLTQITVYLFPIIAIASSIPVFAIIIRYNLMENGICGKFWANVWAVALPWVLAVPLTAGNTVFNSVATYSSIVFQLPINLVVPFWIYIMAMRRKAYLKPCYCEPGPCPHDEGKEHQVPASSELYQSAPTSPGVVLLRARPPDDESPLLPDVVTSHAHVAGPDGSVQRVTTRQPRVKWSQQHPRMAKCCCRAFVRWRDQPPVSPLAPFSLRRPWLAGKLPRSLVAFLDTTSPPAVEHFALPDWWRVTVRQGVAVVIAVLTVIILLLSLGLAVWQSVEGPLVPDSNATVVGNRTKCH